MNTNQSIHIHLLIVSLIYLILLSPSQVINLLLSHCQSESEPIAHSLFYLHLTLIGAAVQAPLLRHVTHLTHLTHAHARASVRTPVPFVSPYSFGPLESLIHQYVIRLSQSNQRKAKTISIRNFRPKLKLCNFHKNIFLKSIQPNSLFVSSNKSTG